MSVAKIGVIGNAANCYQSLKEKFSFTFVSAYQAEIVLNLAPMATRASETRAALGAGKHVYSEGPLAATFEEAQQLVDLAEQQGLLLCAGPDSFMGACLHGARRLLQENVIGRPFAATAQLFRRTQSDWLPEACCYVTALMSFFGAVKRVSGMTTGEHRTGLLRFEGGEVATVVFSYDAYTMPGVNNIEVFGKRGNMTLGNPASFGGNIRIKIGDDGVFPADGSWGGGAWLPIDSPYDVYKDDSRGVGLADMVAALKNGRTPRANAAQALHALEVLCAIERSSADGREIEITTPFTRSPALSLAAEEGLL